MMVSGTPSGIILSTGNRHNNVHTAIYAEKLFFLKKPYETITKNMIAKKLETLPRQSARNA